MLLSLDEAILHCQERAAADCSECAKEHHQLAGWLKELKKYKVLEEQGKLLKLPCAVGDTYYRIENDGANLPYIREWKVGTIGFCVNVRDSIGKTVFLTREEAETALRIN